MDTSDQEKDLGVLVDRKYHFWRSKFINVWPPLNPTP